MKRGDIVVVALPRDYGKPRPAVIVQSDHVASQSVLLCPFTSDLSSANLIRVQVDPSPANGLKVPSQVMVEKITPVPRERCGDTIGRLDDDALDRIGEALILVLGIAD